MTWVALAMRERQVTLDRMETALDFWLGDWDCRFEGGRATNHVTREYDGHVVVERFATLPGPEEPPAEGFEGLSVSVHDPVTDTWRQTWVDSDGSYWAFRGSPLPGGSFEFRTPTRVDADQVFKRMVFSDIESDRFHWRWEFSADGEAWQEKWAIDYVRAQP